jgi:tRNA dimethylallyltransferase
LSRKKGVKYDFLKFAIDMDREKLYERINLRVDLMLENGLVDEVKNLIQKYPKCPTAMQALGYKEVVEYLDGKCSYEEMVEKIKQETRHYAKRQLTWFRKNNDYTWLKAENGTEENAEIIFKELRQSGI